MLKKCFDDENGLKENISEEILPLFSLQDLITFLKTEDLKNVLKSVISF